MARIAIIGGGLTGLTVAYRRVVAGDDVTLFESAPRLGGQLWTAAEDGWIVELGAEGFVARSEAVPRLAADVAQAAEVGAHRTALIDQQVTTSFRFDGAALRALAPGEAAAALSFQVAAAHRGAGIRTLESGMQALTDALADAVRGRAALQVGASVTVVEADGSKVRVDGAAYDAVVVATSSAAAARLLAPIVADDELARAETLSSVTVSLGYPASAVHHALEGTGFVVGDPFEGFRACTFTSSKFTGRAPPGEVSLRVFFRPTREELETDVPWAERAARVLGEVLPIDGPPSRTWVSRWSDALPVFSPAHLLAVERAERALAPHPILLAGSAFHGSGIDAAVRSAEAAAARLGAS